MRDLNQIISELITRKEQGKEPITLLAVCPNSSAVLEAAVKAAARNRSVMLFAATLNQVDYESSYTGWTPADFVQEMHKYAEKYTWDGPLYPCLDHGGPWLKDLHTLEKLSYPDTMEKVKSSITSCVKAGYRLLHIDPTVDRTLPAGQAIPLEVVVERTVELIWHAEQVRIANDLPRIDYEVGTEEVHGGMVDFERFERFIKLLALALKRTNLDHCWPCLLVAQIGTDLHTSTFQPELAQRLYRILAPFGSLAKGHYTDWVENPRAYPSSGMGAANVGPEFTAEEYQVLSELDDQEMLLNKGKAVARFMTTLRSVVIESGRWKKWLQPDELVLPFNQLKPARQEWLLKTSSRYIWIDPRVVNARLCLYDHLGRLGIDAHQLVIERISKVIEKYITAFNLKDSIETLSG
jgi:D-tagatose-1,6-bisphosphate aldolase subunit GatZ/KbaZ